MILFVIKNIYHPAALKLSVNSLKYIETAFSWRKDESYSQYNHPHLNHKVWKKHVYSHWDSMLVLHIQY